MSKYYKVILYDLSIQNKIFVEITDGLYKNFKIMFHDFKIVFDENKQRKREYDYELLYYPPDFKDTDAAAYQNFIQKLYDDISRDNNGDRNDDSK
jgi:hypothetical protein